MKLARINSGWRGLRSQVLTVARLVCGLTLGSNVGACTSPTQPESAQDQLALRDAGAGARSSAGDAALSNADSVGSAGEEGAAVEGAAVVADADLAAAGGPRDAGVSGGAVGDARRAEPDAAATDASSAVDMQVMEQGLGCDSAAAWLCDSFEQVEVGGPPDVASWSLLLGSGSSLAVDDSQAVHGQHSVSVRITERAKWAYMRTDRIFPDAAEGFWGRVYLRIAGPRPGAEGLVHWNLVEAESGDSPLKLFRYGGISDPQRDVHHFLWNHEMRPRPQGFAELGQDDDRQPPIPYNTWLCVEWQFDAQTDSSRLFWDGEERPTMHVVGQVGGTAFDLSSMHAVNLGWALYQEIQAPYQVWIDGVELGPERIGCGTFKPAAQ